MEVLDVLESRHFPAPDGSIAPDVANEEFLAAFFGDAGRVINALINAADARPLSSILKVELSNCAMRKTNQKES